MLGFPMFFFEVIYWFSLRTTRTSCLPHRAADSLRTRTFSPRRHPKCSMLWPSLPQGPTVYQQQRHLLLSLLGPASVSSFPVRATMSCFTVSRGSAGFSWTRESWPLYPRKIEDVFSTCSHHHLLGTRFWDSTRLFRRGWYRQSGQGVSVYSTLVSCPWGSETPLESHNTFTGTLSDKLYLKQTP